MKINIITLLVGLTLAVSLQCCNSKTIGEKCVDLDFTINGYDVLSTDCDYNGAPSLSDTQQYLTIVENRDVIINLIHDEFNLGDFEIRVDDEDQKKHIFQNLEKGRHKLSICTKKECLHKYIWITKRIVSYEDIEQIVEARIQMNTEFDEGDDLISEKLNNSISNSPISSETEEQESKKDVIPSTSLTRNKEFSRSKVVKKVSPSEEDLDGDGIPARTKTSKEKPPIPKRPIIISQDEAYKALGTIKSNSTLITGCESTNRCTSQATYKISVNKPVKLDLIVLDSEANTKVEIVLKTNEIELTFNSQLIDNVSPITLDDLGYILVPNVEYLLIIIPHESGMSVKDYKNCNKQISNGIINVEPQNFSVIKEIHYQH